MEVSRYNFFNDVDGRLIVYNAAKGSFTELERGTYDALRRGEVPALAEVYLGRLADAGVIHDGNQREAIASKFELDRFATTRINITIAPTIECNLACWYCYQNDRRFVGKMDEETQEATLEFISAITTGRETFNVDWYGGEPLLAADVIASVCARIKDRQGRAPGPGTPHYMGGGIVTNGVLLDREKVDMLLEAGVRTAQISIDRLVHQVPRERGLISKDGSPSPILANVLRFKDKLNIGLRINLTALPEGELEQIIETLREHGIAELAQVARAEDNIAECRGPRRGATPAGMMTRKAYAKVKAGFNFGTQAAMDVLQEELTPRSGFCGATNGGMYVIDHRGDVSRCYISAGVKAESIGNVRDLRESPEAARACSTAADAAWRGYSPFNYDSCRSCRVLPLCMGGCSHARVLHDAIHPPCESIKYNVNVYVREISRRLPAVSAG